MLLENRGRRVSLRALIPDDADWLATIYASQEFSRLYRANVIPADAAQIREELLQRNQIDPASLGCIEFVVLGESGERNGVAGLVDYSPLHRRAEFLIGIAEPRKRHSHIAVEATLLVLDLAFNHYGLNKLYTYVYGYNNYAESNTLKLGFRQEGLLHNHHFCKSENCFVNLYLNGMTIEDFRSSKQISRLSSKLLGRDITLEPNILALEARGEMSCDQSGNFMKFLQGAASNLKFRV